MLKSLTNKASSIIKTEGRKNLLILLTMAIIFFLVRIGYAMFAPIDLDEGQLIYDAHLFSSGFRPFVDYSTRAPFLLYALIGIEKIMGSYHLVNGAILISLLFATASIFFYGAVRTLGYSQKIALWSALIFQIFPVFAFYSYVLHTSQSAVAFTVIFVSAFFMYIKKKDYVWLGIAAVVLVITYLIRRDTLFFGPIVVLYIYLIHNNWRIFLKHFLAFLAISVAVLFLLSFPIMRNIGLVGFEQAYGVSSMLMQSQTTGASISSGKNYYLLLWLAMAFPFIYLGLRLGIVILQKKIKFLFNKFIPLGLFCGLVFIIGLGLAIIPRSSVGVYNILNSYYLAAYLVASALIILLVEKKISFASIISGSNIFLHGYALVQAGLIFTLYALFTNNLVFEYMLGVFTLLFMITVPIIIRAVRSMPRNYFFLNAIFLVSIVFIFGILNVEFLTAPLHSRTITQSVLKEMDRQLSSVTQPGDAIFTVDTSLVINSDVEIIPPITHHRNYDSTDCNGYSTNLPCLYEIPNELESNNISVVVVGSRTNGIINRSIELKQYLEQNFSANSELLYNHGRNKIIIYTRDENSNN